MRYIDLKVISSDIIHVKGLNLNPVPITSGSVNDIACRFEFSSHWDSFKLKTAVFSGSGQTRSVIIEDGLAVIPWECITLAGGELRVGVVGASASDESNKDYAVFTSEEICIGTIVCGADIDSDPSSDPTPGVAEQLLLKFDWLEKSENDRIESEQTRKDSEIIRLENEKARIENESIRQQNEQVRIDNEASREQTINGIDSRIEGIEKRIDVIPEKLDIASGNIFCTDTKGKMGLSNIRASQIMQIDPFNKHVVRTAYTDEGAHGIRLHNGFLQFKKDYEWKNYVMSPDDMPIPTSNPISSDFEENSWEDIALVARYGNPSRYWKVGQFKEIEMPFYSFEIGAIHNISFFNRDNFMKHVNYEEGTYNVTIIDDPAFGFIPKITSESGASYTDIYNETQFKFTKTYDSTESKYTVDAYITGMVVTKTTKNVPAQIIGFNHDDVAFPESYGKNKAGLTLMLGCTSSYYKDGIGVYDNHIPYCSVSLSDNHIISPNTLDSESKITKIGSNWSSGMFRIHLANHLSFSMPDVIKKNAVFVKKMTSNKFSAKNYYREIKHTTDKYFLLSEYEMYGEQIVTKANEGDQYEFFKKGNSKLIMTPEIYDAVQGNAYKTYTNGRLWLRSVASMYTDPYIPSMDYYALTSDFTDNPNYTNDGLNIRTNSLLMSYNIDSGLFNYAPGAAYSNSTPAYVAPCFCL